MYNGGDQRKFDNIHFTFLKQSLREEIRLF